MIYIYIINLTQYFRSIEKIIELAFQEIFAANFIYYTFILIIFTLTIILNTLYTQNLTHTHAYLYNYLNKTFDRYLTHVQGRI